MTGYPITSGVRHLRERGVPFTPHVYPYEDHGGTARASQTLGIPEHQVVKTLVFEADGRKPFLVLMHGDREVSTRQLARMLGTKHAAAADPATAQRVTGYQVGGISPFGTRTALPVYVERTILSLPRILINGGKRGFLVGIAPLDLSRALDITPVSVAVGEDHEPL